jgi:hypothetical protein
MEFLTHVFVVQHVHVINKEDDIEDVKMIGVYATEELAQQAIERTLKLQGFRSAPDGFHIDRYEVNKDHWTSGYFTTYYREDGTEYYSDDEVEQGGSQT